MKKALITGMNGTIGRALKLYLETQGVEAIAWDRDIVAIDDYYAMEYFVRGVNPDVLFHLAVPSQSTGLENESWLVNYEWTSELAWITQLLDVKFIFTSSVMVFTNDAMGPFTLDSKPDAVEGYGYEKYQAEERAFYQNPESIVARLGWQIGEADGSNNMINHLTKQIVNDGEIRASTKWLPACSFLEDTVATLYQLAQGKSGLYLVDSNEKWTYHEIVSAISQKEKLNWNIIETDDFVYDQRMVDKRVPIPSLKKRLPVLK